jgi:hypothetical protein
MGKKAELKWREKKKIFFAAFLKWAGGSPIKGGGGRQGEGRGAQAATIQ